MPIHGGAQNLGEIADNDDLAVSLKGHIENGAVNVLVPESGQNIGA